MFMFQGAWRAGLTSGRRLNNANHFFREHQLPGHDDRGEGCRHDSCKQKINRRAMHRSLFWEGIKVAPSGNVGLQERHL